jgi:hypothetical protein
MWDVSDPMQEQWSRFELSCSILNEVGQNMATRLEQLDHLPGIDDQLQGMNPDMNTQFLKTILFLWNRTQVRTLLKVQDSLEILLSSMNSSNAYGCAISSRGIIEHVALLQFLAKDVPWAESQTVLKEDLIAYTKKLFLLSQGSTFDWDRLFSGEDSIRDIITSGEWRRPRKERIPRISEMVEALDDEMTTNSIGSVRKQTMFLYCCMSDVLHPSWGGDFLYADSMHRHYKESQTFDAHFKRVVTLFCLPVHSVTTHLAKLIGWMADNEPKLFGSYGLEK